MSQLPDQAQLAGELRLNIDRVATDLLLNGPSADITESLKELSKAAERAGFGRIPQIVSGVLNELPASANDPSRGEELVRNALTLAQDALTAAPVEQIAPVVPAPAAKSLAEDPELVGDFIQESKEHLASVEANMLTLEQRPDNKEAIHTVFRGFHTIKGLAGFLEFTLIRDVAHEVETLLDLARNEKLAVSGAVVDVVLESVDYLKQSVQVIESQLRGGSPQPLGDNRQLLKRLEGLIHPDPAAQPADAGSPETSPALVNLSRSLLKPELPGLEDPAPEAVVADFPVPEAPAKEDSDGKNRKKGDTAAAVIRVQTAKLDYLMDMVGEMVITQSLIRHNPTFASLQSSKLLTDLSQLARITNEVQRTTMAMRMMKIDAVFQRSSRLVRDLARKAGKRVQLDISGEETEVDKTIAEELTDPLLHMVRNACDHGIETPENRIAAGKNPTAQIKLAAYHQGGQIVVKISDDGHGLDREKILAKAVQKGLVEAGAHLGEQEIFNLIFEPGFSTAAQITDLSGRGVGMDVVRRNIQKLRGRVEIQSKLGQGTTFFLKLPLTLAIIEGLVVGVGTDRYIVPIFAVREIISPKPGSLSTVHGRNEMVMVRDAILPVLRLSKRFSVKPRSEDPYQAVLIVTECQDQLFCLMVDEVLGKQEVVIKSLGESLKNIPGVAGGAILGDGRVGLILDLDGVFRGQKL
jgi:two-component system chemotaxis sensor kinase CheA